jgi:Ca2+-binding EF-hand superfamily protein
MATQNVNVGINISDNGTAKKTIQSVNELHSAVKATQKSAEKLAVPKAAGYRAAAAPSGTEAMMSNQEYGRSRGATGATGAAARDFANQAQGLGGLVRLYATYAANVFAVGAAFRALSTAMDTANLVKGLDQLGAASGTALGTLSKRLVQVTDGAISMREAMEATAKASSSGMSSENILRMGKVAKQAAQALGVDMADAVNRLTRGITKLEPELLDEIGIFTKVGMATEAYAKSVGKSASAITDFEKRMAFANAVLEEGERKFSAIDFETNPYTKLLATLKDVAQTGLELVNKVFAPIVKFLSENPKALALALGAVGLALVKQALPAIGQFKAGLRAAADESAELAQSKAQDAVAAQAALNKIASDAATQTANKSAAAIADSADRLKKANLFNMSAVQELFAQDLTALSKENLAAVNKSIADVEKQAKAVRRQIETAQKEGEGPNRIAALKEQEAALLSYTATIQNSVKEEQKLAALEDKRSTMVALNQKIATEAYNKSVKDKIVANAAYNGSLVGVTGAIKLMNAELAASGLQLSAFGRAALFARAGITALAGAITTVMASLAGVMNVIAIVGAVFATLSAVLSKNGKQMDAFNGSITAVDESLKNLDRTLDVINEKPFGEQFNTQSLLASSTAVNEISNSIAALTKNTLEAGKAASSFDQAWDSLKSLFGGGRANNFGEVMSQTVLGTFEKLDTSPALVKAKASIAGILDIDPTSSTDKWETAFAAIVDNEDKLSQVSRAMKALGFATAETADRAEQFDLAMTQSKEALKSLTDQFKVRDPLALFAESVISSSQRTAEALKEPEAAIARLADVVNDPSKIALFGAEDQLNIIKYSAQITEVNKKFEQQTANIRNSTKELQDQQNKVDALNKKLLESTSLGETQDVGAQLNKAKSELDARRNRLAEQQRIFAQTQAEIVEVTSNFPNVAANQFAAGATLLGKSIEASFGKANTAFADAVMNAVGDLPGLADQRYKMEMRKLDSESALLQANIELARQTALNTVALQRTTAENTVRSLEAAQASGDSKDAKALAVARKELDDIVEKERLLKIDPSQALGALKQVSNAAKEGNSAIAKDSSEILGFLSSMAGFSLQQLNIQDAKAAAAFKNKIDNLSEEYKVLNDTLQVSKSKNTEDQLALEISKERNGVLSQEDSAKANLLKLDAINLATAEKNLAIAQKIDVLNKSKETGKVDSVEVDKKIGLLQDQLAANVAKNRLDIEKATVQSIKDQTAEAARLYEQERKLEAIKRSGSDALKGAANRAMNIENETAKQAETFSPEYQAMRDAEIQSVNARYQAERDQIALTDEYKAQSAALSRQIEEQRALATSEAGQAELARLENERTILGQAYEQRKSAISSITNAELESIAQISAARQEAANFDNLVGSIKTLEGLFGGMGSSISSTVEAFGAASKAQQQYAASIKDIEFERDAAQNPEDRAKFEKQLSKTQRDAAKSEISNYGRVAGAAKSLFKEKTAAYKILAATEKVMHITRLGMDIAEMISDAKKTTTSVANTTVRTGASVVEAGVNAVAAVIKAIASMPFPLNLAAGAATAAVVFGLLSQIGGKGKSVNVGGAGNQDGSVDNDGTGTVFGDKGAQSESIKNALEMLSQADPVLMRNSAGMLKHLRNIDHNIAGLGVNLIKALNGESVSASMGIQTGFRDNPIIGGLKELLGGIPLVGGFLSGALGGLAKGLGIGSKTKIKGEGLQFGGQTIQDIIDDGINARFFADVNTKKKVLGVTYSDKTRRQYMSAGEDLELNITRIFQGFAQAAVATGDALGFSVDKVAKDVQNYKVVLQNVALTGNSESDSKKLEAAFSKIGDQLFKKVLPGLEDFVKAGEGYLETTVRVAYGVDEANATLERLGVTAIKYADIYDKQGDVAAEIVRQSIVASELNFFIASIIDTMDGGAQDIADTFEALDGIRDLMVSFGASADYLSQEAVRAAGGLDKLSDAVGSFYDKFTTEQQKLALASGKVVQLFSQLNIDLPNTREELLQLVNGLTNTDPAAATKIILATEALDTFYASIEKIAEEREGLSDKLFDLMSTESQKRGKLIGKLDESNRELQRQIYLIEDRLRLEQKLAQFSKNFLTQRVQEINNLDQSNRSLQLQVYLYEDLTTVLNNANSALTKAAQSVKTAEGSVLSIQNTATDQYIAATQKVADAQKSISNLAIEAARKMREFGTSLREFIREQTFSSMNNGAGETLQLNQAIQKALTGDTDATGQITTLAQQAIDSAKATSSSAADFATARANILAKVAEVAKFTEAQAAAVLIPEDEDPLLAANKALTEAIEEQTKAQQIANTIGASLTKLPEDLIAKFAEANFNLQVALKEEEEARLARAAAQAALDNIVKNTSKFISAINGADQSTKELAVLTAEKLTALDKTLDGNLTFAELKSGLNGLATEDQITKLIDAVDTNGDNFIDAYELELFNSTKSIVAALSSGFGTLDRNLDGVITNEEFMAVMAGKASDNVLKSVFALIDSDNDKLITNTEATVTRLSILDTANGSLKASVDAVKSSTDSVKTSTDSVDETSGETTSVTAANTIISAGLYEAMLMNTTDTVAALQLVINGINSVSNKLTDVVSNTGAIAKAVGEAAKAGTTSNAAIATLGKNEAFGQAIGALLGGGSFGSAVGGIVTAVADVGKAIGKIFSDERTKTNITPYKTLNNGINLYDYNYKSDYASIYGSDRKRGVLAQEVMYQYPGAVSVAGNGMYIVDYSKLPVSASDLKFAKGGAFSSSIITRPTAFPIGLMGEAGPEAVMPLARTSTGSLGVVAQTNPGDTTTREMLTQNAQLIQEVKQLREEVGLLRYEARATASATGKTTRLLERVTQNGDSLLVTDAATV